MKAVDGDGREAPEGARRRNAAAVAHWRRRRADPVGRLRTTAILQRPAWRMAPVASPHGEADLRPRERVRRHVHAARAAPAEPRRGRPLPVPPRRQLGPQLQRVPAERRPAVPRRRLAPRVRHAGVRLAVRARRPRQGRRADPREPRRVGRAAPRRGVDPRHDLPVQEQHRLGRQQLRLPRELLHQPPRRPRPLRRGADPVPRQPPDLRRRRQGAAHRPRRHVLDRPARRAHLGGRQLGDHPQPPDHQHPRRAARRRRALPPPARHRRRLQHERVHDVPQGRRGGVHAADARGPQRRAARHDAGEPDPGDPRDQPRPDVPAHRAPRQRPRGQRPRHPARVPRPGAALRRDRRASRRSSSGRWRCGSTASRRSRTTR